MVKINVNKGLVGFDDTDIDTRQANDLKVIHLLAREFERRGQDGKAHYRIALIEELTKEPTSLDYMLEKLEGLFR